MSCSACPNEKIFASGLCSGCYSRKRRRGTVDRKNVVNSGSCAEPGCDRGAFAKNFCALHYQRNRHPLTNIWKVTRSRAIEGYPAEWQTFEGFLNSVGDRPSPRHQLRRPDPTKAWSAANMVWREPIPGSFKGDRKNYARKWDLRKKYNLTIEQVEEMAKEQNGLCATCSAVLGDGGTKVCVDHDHMTRKVRGLLCDPCNKGIGHFSDDPTRLRAAAAYLEKHAGV